jgi:hypothetical protein
MGKAEASQKKAKGSQTKGGKKVKTTSTKPAPKQTAAKHAAPESKLEEFTIVQHGGERAIAEVSEVALKHGVVILGNGANWYNDGLRRHERDLVAGKRLLLNTSRNSGGVGPVGIGVLTQSFSAADVFQVADGQKSSPPAAGTHERLKYDLATDLRRIFDDKEAKARADPKAHSTGYIKARKATLAKSNATEEKTIMLEYSGLKHPTPWNIGAAMWGTGATMPERVHRFARVKWHTFNAKGISEEEMQKVSC